MNRALRRHFARLCARQGHVVKTDGNARPLPTCTRCGALLEGADHG